MQRVILIRINWTKFIDPVDKSAWNKIVVAVLMLDFLKTIKTLFQRYTIGLKNLIESARQNFGPIKSHYNKVIAIKIQHSLIYNKHSRNTASILYRMDPLSYVGKVWNIEIMNLSTIMLI